MCVTLLIRCHVFFITLEGARASTGSCVDVSMQWTNDINESNYTMQPITIKFAVRVRKDHARNQRGFGLTPLFTNPPQKITNPPPDLNISNSISHIVFQVGPLMSMSSVSTSIQHNCYDRRLGTLLIIILLLLVYS